MGRIAWTGLSSKPSIITGILKSRNPFLLVHREIQLCKNAQTCMLLPLKVQEGNGPKNVGSLQKLDKQENGLCPRTSRKKLEPC